MNGTCNEWKRDRDTSSVSFGQNAADIRMTLKAIDLQGGVSLDVDAFFSIFKIRIGGHSLVFYGMFTVNNFCPFFLINLFFYK